MTTFTTATTQTHAALLAADNVPLHLLLIGGDTPARRHFLSASLNLIDDRDEAAVIYDPTGQLAAEFYLEAHGDVQLAPLPSAASLQAYDKLYDQILTEDEPSAIRLVQPHAEANRTWNAATWADTPAGWAFVTHRAAPSPIELVFVSGYLTSLVRRLAAVSGRTRRTWLVLDEPPTLPGITLPLAALEPAFGDAAGLQLILTIDRADSFDDRYGRGAAALLAGRSHTTVVLADLLTPQLTR